MGNMVHVDRNAKWGMRCISKPDHLTRHSASALLGRTSTDTYMGDVVSMSTKTAKPALARLYNQTSAQWKHPNVNQVNGSSMWTDCNNGGTTTAARHHCLS